MTYQERWAEGPPDEPGTNRVLSEEEVFEIEMWYNTGQYTGSTQLAFARIPRLIASHRLLAEMVKQYERKDYGE